MKLKRPFVYFRESQWRIEYTVGDIFLSFTHATLKDAYEFACWLQHHGVRGLRLAGT